MSDNSPTIFELPPFWQKKIRGLKTENQKMRQERNDARAALVSIVAERDAARAELAALRGAE